MAVVFNSAGPAPALGVPGVGLRGLLLKSNKLRCYFVENPQSPFYESELFQSILAFVQQEGHRQGLSFKKSTRHFMLIKDHVRSLQKALKVLRKIKGKVKEGEEVVA